MFDSPRLHSPQPVPCLAFASAEVQASEGRGTGEAWAEVSLTRGLAFHLLTKSDQISDDFLQLVLPAGDALLLSEMELQRDVEKWRHIRLADLLAIR